MVCDYYSLLLLQPWSPECVTALDQATAAESLSVTAMPTSVIVIVRLVLEQPVCYPGSGWEKQGLSTMTGQVCVCAWGVKQEEQINWYPLIWFHFHISRTTECFRKQNQIRKIIFRGEVACFCTHSFYMIVLIGKLKSNFRRLCITIKRYNFLIIFRLF